MEDVKLLKSIEDRRVLMEAYAASSSYVLRKAFAASEKLKEFEGREDLAPDILSKVEKLAEKPNDPVIIGAHLYALELTRAKPQLHTAVLRVLEKENFQEDPLIGQFAGGIAFKLVKTKKQFAIDAYFTKEELQGVVKALKQE